MDDSRHGAIVRARAAGVRGFLLAGVDPAGWLVQERLCRENPDMWAAYGVHPQVIAALPEEQGRRMVAALPAALRCFLPSAQASPAPVAVGEIGLDGLGEARRQTWAAQEQAFRRQLAIAREHDLPVVLHILRAHERALAILRDEPLPARGGVVHSYSGPAELVPRYLDVGLHLSFAGALTYENARKGRAALLRVPDDRLLLETDCPDQAPVPHRPGPSEPAFLVAISAEAARIRQRSLADVVRITADNARRLFGLPAA